MDDGHSGTLRRLATISEQAQIDAIFTSIGDGAIATDEYGKITRVNPAALRILGFRRVEILDQWFPKVIVALSHLGEAVSLIDRPITKAFLTGKPITERMHYLKRDGSNIPVSVTVSPIMVRGRPMGAIEIFRDITLEYEIDKMKSDFISLASHQLRTPLSAIKTYTHMLAEGYMGAVNEAQKQSLSTIVEASNRMNELISTLLNVSRIESGSIIMALKPVDMKRLSQSAINDLKHQSEEKQITISFSAPKPEYIVSTDNLLMKEIVTNLISNAIKYTPEGGKILVSLRHSRGELRVSVKDNGIGIPKFAQDQIFTKFFRADNVIKRETTGTGLGLYLVKNLVEMLGGTIVFESTEHEGSTFHVTIPTAL